MSRATLALLVALAAGLAFAPAAGACTLAPPATQDPVQAAQQRMRAADVAIYGVVLSVQVLEPPAAPEGPAESPPPAVVGEEFEARVRVARVFRGTTWRVVRVRGNTNGALCGIGRLQPRQRVGLLLDRPGRPFRVSLASRTTLSELLRATDGRWRRPY
jgi:hypothetical protein